ncbi:AMP-binding protein [uncultured Brevundimonas sp.]|uniref:class I adenylate-forming enzyme family protein n=1 Tax=uncultured Brevundimonas sp. TaxID=213418 RepID=UPI00261CA0C5|nr:AMP-binding protein [uncultured Brevundimonas sp.]
MSGLAHSVAPRPLDDRLHTPQNLAHMLSDCVEQVPDREAVICNETRWSYADLGLRVTALAERIAARVKPNDIVVVIAPNSAGCVAALLAVMASGARVLPVNPFYPRHELAKLFIERPALILSVPSTEETARHLASDLGCDEPWCITDAPAAEAQDVVARLRTLADRIDSNDAALLIFTGGTTGRSKAVEHCHRALIQSVKQHATVWALRYDVERILNVAPVFHIWAFGFAMLAPIYLRGTLVLIERYAPEQVLDAIDRHKVTVFAGGPAPIYYGLLHSPSLPQTRFDTLELALTGGAACPQTLKEAWRKAANCDLLEGWGMSEGAPLCLNWRGDNTPDLSVGRPVPDAEAQIVDVDDDQRILEFDEIGEVRVRGPQLMTAYRLESGEPDQSLRHGWLYTGDIGRINSDGYVSLVDRKKEIIIVGGYNVYPRDVEDTLRRHPDVMDVAVVARKDDYLGETPVAFIVSKTDLNEDSLHSFCQEHLVKYKRPTRFIRIDELPRTGPSKINKIALREMIKGLGE